MDTGRDESVEVLGSQNIAKGGPFKLEMQVHLVATDGQHEGFDAWATIVLPPGEIPTVEQIEARLAGALDAAGSSFRLAGRHEFVRHLLRERTGSNVNFAVPGPNTFAFNPAAQPPED